MRSGELYGSKKRPTIFVIDLLPGKPRPAFAEPVDKKPHPGCQVPVLRKKGIDTTLRIGFKCWKYAQQSTRIEVFTGNKSG